MVKRIGPERLSLRLEASAAFLEACARNKKINWRLPVVERQYTVMDVLKQAVEHIGGNPKA